MIRRFRRVFCQCVCRSPTDTRRDTRGFRAGEREIENAVRVCVGNPKQGIHSPDILHLHLRDHNKILLARRLR